MFNLPFVSDMSSNEERMDGFTDVERVVALKNAKAKLEADLQIFKDEEILAFELVEDLDEKLKDNSTPELIERRRQKFVWASGLKWNILYQEKEIRMCAEAIAKEESLLLNSSILQYGNVCREA